MCSQNYDHWKVLQKHMLDKHKIQFYSCMLCANVVTPFESFEQHVREIHNGKFTNQTSFKGIETGPSNTITKAYSITIFRLEDAIGVDVVSTEVSTYSCKICGETHAYEQDFYNHVEKSHFFKDKLCCHICNHKIYIQYIVEHYNIHHATKKSVHFSVERLQYNYMITMFDQSKKCLSVYQARKIGRKFMSCNLCTENFNDYMAVNKHLAMVHNVIAFNCLNCSVTLWFDKLEKHTEVCLQKPNRFVFLENLIASIVPKLKWMFIFARDNNDQFTVKIMKTWSQNDIYECEMCESRFFDLSALDDHITASHFFYRLYNCPRCLKNFAFNNLQSHYTHHHPPTAKKQVAMFFKTNYYFHFSAVKENYQIFVKVSIFLI